MTRTATFSRRPRAAGRSRDAVTFNKTWLSNDGIPGMPTGLSLKGIIAVNWRCTTVPAAGTTGKIIQTNGSDANFISLAVANLSGSPCLQLLVTGATGSDTYYAVGAAAVLGAWNQDVIGFDMSVPQVKWLSNGSAASPQLYPTGSGWAVDYTRPWAVGAQGVSGHNVLSPFLGDMADLTLWANAFVDPTDLSVTPAFYYVNGEVPMRIGPVGWGTLDAFGNLRPQICLSGPASQFPQNLTACTFDPWGTGGGYHDTTPTSMFTVGAGSLVNSASDPWNDPP